MLAIYFSNFNINQFIQDMSIRTTTI